MTEHEVTDWIAYHEPSKEQVARCVAVRSRVADVARTLVSHTTPGPEQTYCLHKLRDAMQAMMTAIVSPMPPNQRGDLD